MLEDQADIATVKGKGVNAELQSGYDGAESMIAGILEQNELDRRKWACDAAEESQLAQTVILMNEELQQSEDTNQDVMRRVSDIVAMSTHREDEFTDCIAQMKSHHEAEVEGLSLECAKLQQRLIDAEANTGSALEQLREARSDNKGLLRTITELKKIHEDKRPA